jgi:hypothetical protein
MSNVVTRTNWDLCDLECSDGGFPGGGVYNVQMEQLAGSQAEQEILRGCRRHLDSSSKNSGSP